MVKAGDQCKSLESKIVLCYLFLNAAKMPKITTEAIIPAMPSVSFVWNKNAEPIKTAEDVMLPERIAFDFCFICCCKMRFSSMYFFNSGAIVTASLTDCANFFKENLISSTYASLIKFSSSIICEFFINSSNNRNFF